MSIYYRNQQFHFLINFNLRHQKFIVQIVLFLVNNQQLFVRMGLLSDLGPIQNYEETQKQQPVVKKIGVKQFLNCLSKYQCWKKPMNVTQIKWGQEIEGHFLQYDENGELKLSNQGFSEEYKNLQFPLVLEYGSWMFQIIPKDPYNTLCNFQEIIQSIRYKYQTLQKKSRIALTIPVIPFIGIRNKSQENKPFLNQYTQSLYFEDNFIAPHIRFFTMTKNFRLRRERTMEIQCPLFIDQKTNLEEIRKTEPREGVIFMDAQGFGMGSSCLQCTFSTKSLSHARYIYDMMNVISPLFLAITAGSPFFKGKLSDLDTRWSIIAGSVDDRTPNQRNEKHQDYIPNSRYCESNYYISNGEGFRKEYNDYDSGVRQKDIDFITKIAQEEGIEIDEILKYHLASIFRRDYFMIHEAFKTMSKQQTMVFDMLNGTNWNSVRLKVPTDEEIGWRVEFRTMEIQLTPDQNSALSLFIHLIARILHQNPEVNLYMPITLLRQNFARAQKRDAVLKEKFYFRTNIYDQGQPVIEELSIYEIMFGKNSFKGLFFEVQSKMQDCVKMCEHVEILMDSIKKYFLNISTGKKLTLAKWIRNYINDHPDYKKDSILSKKVMDDTLITLDKISKQQILDPNFTPVFELWNKNQKKKTQLNEHVSFCPLSMCI